MQLSFSFSQSSNIYDINNFIVHRGNKDIFDFVTSSCFINNNIYFLTGAPKSGKTYVCKIWNKIRGATFLNKNIFELNSKSFLNFLNNNINKNSKYILEDIENIKINELYLLQLINIIIEKNSILLITSKKFVKDFEFKIKDLNSRFHNIFNFTLVELDEESKEKIILKLLTDKQLNISSNVLEQISKKISGNYQKIFEFVNSIDELVKTNKIKRITMNNIKTLL